MSDGIVTFGAARVRDFFEGKLVGFRHEEPDQEPGAAASNNELPRIAISIEEKCQMGVKIASTTRVIPRRRIFILPAPCSGTGAGFPHVPATGFIVFFFQHREEVFLALQSHLTRPPHLTLPL